MKVLCRNVLFNLKTYVFPKRSRTVLNCLLKRCLIVAKKSDPWPQAKYCL